MTNPYGDPIPCRPGCLCQCNQPSCACRETPKTPKKKATP